MPYTFTVTPALEGSQDPHWPAFGAWVQASLGEPFQFELFPSAGDLRTAILEDRVDLVCASPVEASLLVREKGFLPVAAGLNRFEEVVAAAPADGPIARVLDLQPPISIASTSDPIVRTLGRLLLEPADLGPESAIFVEEPTTLMVAGLIIQGGADIAFFAKARFDRIEAPLRSRLQPIATSQFGVVRHALYLGPRLWNQRSALVDKLTQMRTQPEALDLLRSLDLEEGWTPFSQEEAELMIDLVDTMDPT